MGPHLIMLIGCSQLSTGILLLAMLEKHLVPEIKLKSPHSKDAVYLAQGPFYLSYKKQNVSGQST